MSRSRRHLLVASVALLALSGCVAIEEYEKKSDEASGLRREFESANTRIQNLRREIGDLEKKIEGSRVKNEELSQSLTMARRHSQQIETRVADLRAQVSSERAESKQFKEKSSNLERDNQASLEKIRGLEKNLVNVRRRLLRFEDKIRFQDQLNKDMRAQFSRERRAGTIQVRRDSDRVKLSVSSAILFASGSANIRSGGKRLLTKISRVLRRYVNREIQVQGHTDNVRISERLAERWETNWELSAARATRVLRFLVEVGNIDPRRASAAGLGEFRPIANNSTKSGRRRNRRIEIVIFPPES